MGSSYTDKIYPALLDTVDGRALWNEAVENLKTLHIDHFEFECADAGYSASKPIETRTRVRFVSATGFTISCLWFASRPDTSKPVELNALEFFPEAKVNAIINTHFGKTVPTYNGTKTVVREGKGNRKSSRTIQSFRDWLKNTFEAFSMWKTTREALCEPLTELSRSDEFKAQRQEARIQFAALKIKNVMSKYSYLGEDALKRGVQTFVIGDILES